MSKITDEDRDILRKSPFFRGLDRGEVDHAIEGLFAAKRSYRKGQSILAAGDETKLLGMMLAGSATIENNDVWGNRTVLSKVGRGQFFAEVFALLDGEPSGVDVRANTAAEVAFFDMARLKQQGAKSVVWAEKILRNMLDISLQKSLLLTQRSSHTSPKTARGRIMAYLSTMAIKSHSAEFDIPFDRQQMADYLNLDRSALSKELGRMRDEGLISYRKNHFELTGENLYFPTK